MIHGGSGVFFLPFMHRLHSKPWKFVLFSNILNLWELGLLFLLWALYILYDFNRCSDSLLYIKRWDDDLVWVSGGDLDFNRIVLFQLWSQFTKTLRCIKGRKDKTRRLLVKKHGRLKLLSPCFGMFIDWDSLLCRFALNFLYSHGKICFLAILRYGGRLFECRSSRNFVSLTTVIGGLGC